jgi:glycosyltransferase involved in cell wall biosynthesis
MMREIAEELTVRGYRVIVVTSYPREDLRAKKKHRVFSEISDEKGVTVIRVGSYANQKSNYIARGISEIMLPYKFFAKLRGVITQKIKAVIVYSPPLPLAILGTKIKKQYGARYLLNIQDIFPQNAIDLGVLKNRLFVKFYEWIEKRAYDEADRITAHSEDNRQFLIIKKKIPEEKISSIYNWIDLGPYRNKGRSNKFRKKYCLENKFIFLHAGIMGPAQGLELIMRAAEEIKVISDICFLMVGDGSEKNKLQRMAGDARLDNVIFKTFVSKEEYPYLAKDVDVGIAFLSDRNKTPVYPGKILGYMAAGIPIIAFLNSESEGHELIKTARCGYSTLSDDYRKAVKIIRKIYNEKENLERYGHNGLKYAESQFAKMACIDNLENLIQ